MATVGDITTRAAKHLGIWPSEAAPSGPEQLDILAEYNTLMHELASDFSLVKTDGTAYPTHTTQATTNVFPLADRFVNGMAAMIAARSHAYLGAGDALRPETAAAAARGYGRICGAFQKKVVQDAGLLQRERYA